MKTWILNTFSIQEILVQWVSGESINAHFQPARSHRSPVHTGVAGWSLWVREVLEEWGTYKGGHPALGSQVHTGMKGAGKL